MNLFIPFIVLASINLSVSTAIRYKSCLKFYSNQLRNSGLRLIIFKKKTYPKIETKIKKFYELCYSNSISSINEGISNYYSLPEENQLLIESIISLCF